MKKASNKIYVFLIAKIIQRITEEAQRTTEKKSL